MQPNSPFFTPRSAEAWRLEAAAASAGPLRTPPARPLALRLALLALRVVAVLLLVLVLAVWFFLFGEERPARVRPELTPAQRARAFRLPQ